jgi:DNA primase catalytic subunit
MHTPLNALRKNFLRTIPSGSLSASNGLPNNLVMAIEVFRASRWTRGNFLFPTYIEVSDKAVTRRKRSWFSKDEITINISKIASVHIKTGLFWSEILIESSGGTDPLSSHGHTKADALRIKELVENAQTDIARQPAGKE